MVGERTTGDPPSANGASSFHLRWDLSGRFTSVSVDLEVLEAPTVDRLYFWAVQADFADARGRPAGGAHLGLQWHPGHPRSRAVNWGGYDPRGRILDGTASTLPSATGNPHTRDLAWEPGRAHRLTISRAPTRSGDPPGHTRWSGTVSDPAGATVHVRDLFVPGAWVVGAVVWSEVFARCDHPSVAVRWSRPVAVSASGDRMGPRRVLVSYQRVADGGCTNTDSSTDGIGLVQRTAVARRHPPGTAIPVPGAGVEPDDATVNGS